jgi:hypothetical protein
MSLLKILSTGARGLAFFAPVLGISDERERTGLCIVHLDVRLLSAQKRTFHPLAVRGNISSDPVCAEPEILGNVRLR